MEDRVAIIGGGNLGTAIARGLAASGKISADRITITRRSIHLLDGLKQEGFNIEPDNLTAVRSARVVLVTVRPRQLDAVLREIGPALDEDKHILISTVSNASVAEIKHQLGKSIPVLRAMPNIAVAVGESMTALCSDESVGLEAKEEARGIFGTLGQTMFITEEQMTPATALCACGVAFFLRAIRAAAQGGVEVGFHAEDAIRLAAQTARGAATLLLEGDTHPETQIDKVTTPMGVTISGLNEMEHHGFSSAMIRGIVTSAEKATKLYREKENKNGEDH
ncbi:MAG TPA: pyrroline-5-carboxylate reductase [Candidatus Acetothermia bacterium]|nr:pyrroline-5-carboxylate reductase [Candidatus Acetothermia bacterium]